MKTKHLLLVLGFVFFTSFLFAQDYYWRAEQGQGDWSDVNNWITSTGQTPVEIPSESNNVVFDGESFLNPFDTLFITSQNPTCKSIKFINIPFKIVISGGTGITDFLIFGSFTSHQNVINEYDGNYVFMGQEPGLFIKSEGSRFTTDLKFKGIGEYTLMDDLYVFADTVSWDEVVLAFSDGYNAEIDVTVLEGGPKIEHKNGTLLSNNFSINTRGFETTGDLERTLNIANTEVTVIGNWRLNGEGLEFIAENSLITIGGASAEMTNQTGEEINYHDIVVFPKQAKIENSKIRTIHRKIHFLGSGAVMGLLNDYSAGGSFTIDTLMFEGAFDDMGMPIPCQLTGQDHNIHYTQVKLVHGIFDFRDSFFHRVDFDGFMIPDVIRGRNNEYDSVFYNVNGGLIAGIHTVNNIIQFDSLGVISAERDFENNINHAVFKHDGELGGTNRVDSLTMGSGFWYKMAADEPLPTGEHTFVQHIGYMEVDGECHSGNTVFSSNKLQRRGVLDYYGGAIEIQHITIRDMENLNPSIPIVVNEGIDAGNNIGFDITNPASRDFYWINGQGNWSETEHWSLESGGQPMDLCAPTPLDNVIFDANSGFIEGLDTVMIDINHPTVNNFIWKEGIQNLPVMPLVFGNSENKLLVWGDFILNQFMNWKYPGELYFLSDNDPEWEQVHVEHDGGNTLLSKTYFWGDGGKWELTCDLMVFDTLFLNMGELLAVKKQLDLLNFNATDTLTKGLYLIDSTLVQIHQYNADGWVFNGFKMNEITFLDAGWSTIRMLGDWLKPPDPPPGNCNMMTQGSGEDPVTYHNVEFGLPPTAPDSVITETEGCELRSFGFCKYNLVDYYTTNGKALSAGLPSIIDTLTFKGIGFPDGLYDDCSITNEYLINFLMAESAGDTVDGTHVIDTAFFFKQGSFSNSFSNVGYLEAFEDIKIEGVNNVTHGVYHGNSLHVGKNTFQKLELSPDKINSFASMEDPFPYDENVTIITHDLLSEGECDKPIRLQSDSPGKQAQIYYEMIDPTNNFTARYSSIKDIDIQGGHTYLAEESIDLGNNTGWTWIESTDTMYYWIGGTGNWDVSSNWSRESGGAAIDGCVPREIVHVIFDNNSFNSYNDTVYTDSINAYCKDMLWLHDTSLYRPTFFSDSVSIAQLYVYGSMILSPGMDYKYFHEIYFDNIKDTEADSIRSAGNTLLNHIRMQGIGDYIVLADTLRMDTSRGASVFLTHGGFDLNKQLLNTWGFFSTQPNERIINLENSNVNINFMEDGGSEYGWYVNGENLELNAANSTINYVNSPSAMWTKNGGAENILQYHNIVLDTMNIKIKNSGNRVSYNMVYCNQNGGLITGNFIADTILMKGKAITMDNKSTTNVVIVDSSDCKIVGTHNINRVFVNQGETRIQGNNYIEYCYFNAKGEFLGENTFDTLLLFAGVVSEATAFDKEEGNGNIYTFESTKTQTVMDSLFIRGNPCANITIQSTIPNMEAFIRKDFGHDVACDFLNLQDVGVASNQNLFYAGEYSSAIPNPNQPPSGWIMENADNYEFGFGVGKAVQFCKGETVILDGANFNAGPTAEYFWNGADFPGGQYFAADSAGQYALRVYYSPECYQSDYINLETLETPIAVVDPGPYCEGEPIIAVVDPDDKTYNYNWFNGETGKSIIAETYINSVFVTVENTINKCKATTAQAVVVKPAPDPQSYLGNPTVVKFEDSFILDAGIGDTYQWSSFPHTEIIPDDQQTITIAHNNNYGPDGPQIGDVEYYVLVDLDGCQNEGFLKNELLPPSKIGVPTAFSPNGDIHNNELKVQGSGFAEMDFKIYNRYGKLVYESTDWNMGWDGNYNGKKQEMDVYTYYIKVRFEDEAVVEEKGNITLLR